MAAAAILDCQICEISLADSVWGAQTHHHAKCRPYQSFRCDDIAISRILKMAATAIFDFWNHEILLVNGVQRVETHQHAKFRQKWSIDYEHIKIFLFFKIVAVRHLHLGFVWGHIWTTHSEYLGVSIFLQNLAMIDAVVFIIWIFQYLARLAGKCLFMPTKLFLGQLDSFNGLQYQPKPKKAHPCMSPHHLSHQAWKCGERSDLLGELLKKGGINKKVFGVIPCYGQPTT